MRAQLRKVALDILGFFSKPAPGVHILNGHRLIDTTSNDNLLGNVLKHLSNNTRLINPDDAVRIIESRTYVDEPMVAFTFDDGFSECYSHFAPALESYGIKGLFFINPNFAEGDDSYIDSFNKNRVHTIGKKPMRWEQIKELLDRGHIIGAHTLDHVMIVGDDVNGLTHQIADCKTIIKDRIGNECDYFAFPYGRLDDVSDKAIEIACSCYKHVFSQSDYTHYYSFDGRVINRRHFEPFWPVRHIDYFLSCNKKY